MAESPSTIIASCKQTRFHVEKPNYRELDIEGLTISITAPPPDETSTLRSCGRRDRGKTRIADVDILVDATLRLKAGGRYALVGRNGCGKSTLLRAIAEKLIPGIPEETRICMLRQTDSDADSAGRGDYDEDAQTEDGGKKERTALGQVVDEVTRRSEVEQEIKALASGTESRGTDAYAPVRALRRVQHERMLRKLHRLDKDARLRSGARGAQARRTLRAFEKAVAEHALTLDEPDAAIAPETLAAETEEATALLAELHLHADAAGLAETEARARAILAGLGFTPALMTDVPLRTLSGGWRMRAALATALLQPSDILILDEPTNFLDMLGIVWLQRHILASSSPTQGAAPSPTVILVSHDRAFVDACITDTLLLANTTLTAFHGTVSAYHASVAQRTLHLSRMQAAQDRQRAHMERSIQANLRQGRAAGDENKLRQAKARQRRLDERWGLSVNARGGRFKLNRDLAGYHLTARAEIEVPVEERGVVFRLPAVEGDAGLGRAPGALVALEGVRYRYPGGGGEVLRGVTVSVHVGDRVGILGLNGAGKSTLVSVMVGDARPTRGTASFHPRLRLGYFSQDAVSALSALGDSEPSLTALSLLLRTPDADLDEGAARALLGTFGLPGRTASAVPVGKLSGGQLVRLELARVVARRPQCLVLDEVTTHLDHESVAGLRDALRGWAGAVVVVSHDRWFMRGVVEGVVDDGEGSDDEGSEEEEDEKEIGEPRRRTVYRLKGGELVELEGGVGQFEALMEKRVDKMMLGM